MRCASSHRVRLGRHAARSLTHGNVRERGKEKSIRGIKAAICGVQEVVGVPRFPWRADAGEDSAAVSRTLAVRRSGLHLPR